VGVSSLIGAPESVRTQGVAAVTLDQARAQLALVLEAQDRCTSDHAYWGHEGQRAYWVAVVDVLTAAAITGPDDLPDVELPSGGGIVMDSCSRLEAFGRQVLELARQQSGGA